MKVYTEINPAWIEIIAPKDFNDQELFRIVIFYVFHSPCEELSAMSKTLDKYNWCMPWKKPYYLNKQLVQAASNDQLLFSAKDYASMSDALEKAELKDDFPANLSKERICIYNNQHNQFLSVFYHIRNAFAHGRMNMFNVDGECVFVLEDIAPKEKGKPLRRVSARMILKKSTLIKWIDIIEGGEKEFI